MRQLLTQEEIAKAVLASNYALLSFSGKGARTRLLVQCDKGHSPYEVDAGNFRAGKRCPKCSRQQAADKRRTPYRDIGLILEYNGYTIISKEFKDSHQKLDVICPNGHIWQTNYNNFSQGTRCPIGHETKVLYSNFQQGYGCSNCKYKTEQVCREILESTTGLKFYKNTMVLGNRWELDGYCQELNLAFEYHGEQHYEADCYFNLKKDGGLQKQQLRDQEKRLRCQELGIKLIEIPYFVEDKEFFIKSELAMLGVIPL
jgi:hypothetical protein